MSPADLDWVASDGQRGITAVLGPTNTGKTHLAIERMLRHRSGMIGLPLRLLAREVYDRVVVQAGPGAVALLTGEERVVPVGARYFVCTTESMPVDKPVSFVAVDEVQLMAHRTRGHVFTDRVLRARGVLETLLLGSATAAPLVAALVPTAKIVQQPRLSRLSHAGHAKLGRVPPRSAVVVFSTQEVYAVAEQLRAKHGGVAVVLGALSPRTRNAQVALYQGGEVGVLVATDAIGMGLNLDLDHVAFAATRKFDGRTARALHEDEIAQIAGRAGRYHRDGTFGTTGGAEPFLPEITDAVEQHLFPPLTRAYWRSAELDTRTIESLIASLLVPPRARALTRMPDADDERALVSLAGRPEVAARARTEEGVRLLWEVAQIPDYRKTLPGAHVDLLAEVFAELRDTGQLRASGVDRHLDHLDRVDGEIDALMTRLAHVRTWNYIGFRDGWVEGSRAVQARARAVEDRLSDTLHERLIQRFVEQRVVVSGPGPLEGEVAVDGDLLRAGSRTLGKIVGLSLVDLTDHPTLVRTAERAARPILEGRGRAASLAPDADFQLDDAGVLSWGGGPIARLKPGPDPSRPRHTVVDLPAVPAPVRAAIRERVDRWFLAWNRGVFRGLDGGDSLSPAGGDLVERVRRSLGTVLVDDVRPVLVHLSDADRQGLARRDIRLGRLAIYVFGWLKRHARRDLDILARIWFGSLPAVPKDDRPAVEVDDDREEIWRAIGLILCGRLAVRPDVLERVAARAREEGRRGPYRLPKEIPSWLAVRPELAVSVLCGLGERRMEVAGEIRLIPRSAGGRRRASGH